MIQQLIQLIANTMSNIMSLASIAISMLTLWIAYARRRYDIRHEGTLGDIRITQLRTRTMETEEPLINIISVEPHLKDQLIMHFDIQNPGWSFRYRYNHIVLLSDNSESEILHNPSVATERESNCHYFRVNRLYHQQNKPVINIANTGPYTLYGWKYVGTLCMHYLISHKDNRIYLYVTRKKPSNSELV